MLLSGAMTKTKAKPRKARKASSHLEEDNLDRSHEKAAIRSEAFAKAILDAQSYSTDRRVWQLSLEKRPRKRR